MLPGRHVRKEAGTKDLHENELRLHYIQTEDKRESSDNSFPDNRLLSGQKHQETDHSYRMRESLFSRLYYKSGN